MPFEHDDQDYRDFEREQYERSMRFDLALESELDLDGLEDDWELE
jgi:hypothetical protein